MTDRIAETTDEQRARAQRDLDKAEALVDERRRVADNAAQRLRNANAAHARAVRLRDYAAAHPALEQPTLPGVDAITVDPDSLEVQP